MPKFWTFDIQMTGTKYAMIKTIYCATCVQVTARMPPSMEQSRMPRSPNQTPTSNGIKRALEAIVPVALICAVTYVKDATTRIIVATKRAALPPYRVPMKSGTV